MELKITKEKVLAAAEKCSTAKEVLKEMFPDVFEEDNPFSHIEDDGTWTDSKLCGDLKWVNKANFRVMSNDKMPHIFLTAIGYDWVLDGNCLYPVKK